MKNGVAAFYDNFDKKLIDDYVLGNPRIESAIKELGSFIKPSSTSILDIGCGIGWSSHEFAKTFASTKIYGIDLSPKLIERAKALFLRSNLEYHCVDITENFSFDSKFDAVSLIDVYEHIPLNSREEFHACLKLFLNDGSRVLLACPSKFHQNWLRANKPEGLQPVDEDVDFKTIQKLSSDIDCEVIFFSYKKIWKAYDYFYAVLERRPRYSSDGEITQQSPIVLESQAERYKRLGIPYSKKNREFKGYYFLKRLKNFFR